MTLPLKWRRRWLRPRVSKRFGAAVCSPLNFFLTTTLSLSLMPAYKRILLKLSGEALMGDDAYGINRATNVRLVREVRDGEW